jgi:hypothetical protein
MLGVMFGVGAVIGMLAIGAGAAAQAQDLIDRLGLRNVLIRARQLRPDELREARRKSLGLSLRDAQAIEEAVPGVELVGPRLKIEPWRVQSAGQKTEGTAYGVVTSSPACFRSASPKAASSTHAMTRARASVRDRSFNSARSVRDGIPGGAATQDQRTVV